MGARGRANERDVGLAVGWLSWEDLAAALLAVVFGLVFASVLAGCAVQTIEGPCEVTIKVERTAKCEEGGKQSTGVSGGP